MRIIKLFCLLLLLCTACNNEEDMGFDRPESSQEAGFRLYATGYTGEGTRTRSADSGARFDRLEYYIFNSHGEIVTNVRSLYDANLSRINAEGFRDGSYELMILGIKGDYKADNAVINKLENNFPYANWLSLPKHGGPLHAEYYYARHSFKVTNGQVDNTQVAVSRIVGKVEFRVNYANDYVRNSIISIEAALNEHSITASDLQANGTVWGERQILTFPVTNDGQYVFLPYSEGTELTGEVKVRSRRHTGELIERVFNFTVTSRPNEHSVVTINVKHPDDNTGMLYIKNDMYTPENTSDILSDSESKDVYYDNNQRSFRIHEPLQVSVVNGKLQLRFYSALPVKHATIYARLPSLNEYVEFAYADSIPAFSNALFNLPMLTTEGVYRTESGRYVNLPAQTAADLDNLKFKIEADDIYWQKISQIRAKWRITFASFGGNPDAEDGGPAGNWMGLRPVHAREGVALMTNIAYMCTLPDYAALLESLQGVVVGNDGQTHVQMNGVIPKLESRAQFNLGLVYTGNGVVGLGGGHTLGVYQAGYLNHYASSYVVSVMFHELGHCMGYSHSSGMTYGRYSQDSGGFYVNNLKRFPVPSADILKSNTNPHRYQ